MLKSYEEYKEINLPWLSDMPKHWTTLRNKNVLIESKETVGDKSSDFTLLSLTTNGVIKRDVESGKGKFPKDFDTYKKVSGGNIIFCLFDIDETPRTVGLSSFDGMITGAYDVFDVVNINSRYLYLYYLAVDNEKAMKPLYTGLRKVISVPKFLGTKLPVPPREEQDQIVRYLDWQLSKINKLIKAMKKQIKLLNEQKKSIVNNAVTHGLNPNVEMKFSGVTWLGNIPKHWDTVKLRQLLSSLSIKNRPNLPLLSVVREQGVIIRDVENKESNHNYIPDDLSGYKMVEKGQFAMNKMKAWQGSYGISPFTGIVSPAYYIFNVNFDNLDYFHYAIRSKVYVNFFAQASDGIRIGQWDLSIQKMKEIPFIVPPKEEQDEIVAYIPKALKKYDYAILKLTEEVALLIEYRTRLISDIVTGKLNVCGIEVPNEQFEAEEIEDTDDIVDVDIEQDVLEDE